MKKQKEFPGENFLLISGYDYGMKFVNLDANWKKFKPWIVSLYVYREEAKNLDPVVNRNGISALEYPFDRIFLCPNSKRNRKYLGKIIDDVIDITSTEEILLDYFRYPNRKRNFYKFIKDLSENDFCYCKYCQRKFEEIFGKSIFDANEEEIIKFRVLSINDLAKFIREEFRDYRIYVTLRANKKQAYEWNGQDWNFLSEVFDRVFVMAYFSQEGGIEWLKEVLDDIKSINNAEMIFLDREVDTARKFTADFYVLID